MLSQLFSIGFFQSTIRLTAPILLAGLGCMFTSRVGIINFAMEGIMLVSAFTGYYGSFISGSPLIGVLFGMMGGVFVALILGFMSINAGVDQVVAGTSINILSLGLSGYLLNSVFGRGSKPSSVISFQPYEVHLLSKIPIIGDIFFEQIPLVYLVYILVPLCWYIIFQTPYGLSIRVIGENPRAADSVGIRVNREKYFAIVISGILGGLGGTCLSIGNLSVFMEGMVAGRGYLAWSIVTIGKWNPFGMLGAAALFAAADALQMRLQIIGIEFPYQLLLMLPYILTMLVLTGVVGKTVAPAAIGRPYIKE